MRKRTFVTIFVGMILLMGMGYLNRAVAEVKINVGVNVPPPPPLVIPAPPRDCDTQHLRLLSPRSGSGSLFLSRLLVPSLSRTLVQIRNYKGPWVYIVPERVPRAVLHLPPNYRHVPPVHQRVPHGQLKKNWRTWERERSTGINTSTNMKEEKDTTSKKAGMDKGEAKGNTATRS